MIAGTSAGGINGIYLAKALAGNRSQDGLRKLWFEKGDMNQLLVYPRKILGVPWKSRTQASGDDSARAAEVAAPRE